jgi:hypothetical protein
VALHSEYEFEDGIGSPTVADSSGNSRDLTVASGVFTTEGHTGDGFASNPAQPGTNGAARAMAGPTAAITVMSWVFPTALGNNSAALVWHDAGSTRCGLFLRRNDFGPGGVVQGNINVGGLVALDGGDSAPVDEWTHLALTYDGTDAVLYVNGAPVDAANLPGSIAASTEFVVAGWGSQGGVTADVVIDDVRNFDNALSEAEINAVISGSVPNIGVTAFPIVLDIEPFGASDKIGAATFPFQLDLTPSGVAPRAGSVSFPLMIGLEPSGDALRTGATSFPMVLNMEPSGVSAKAGETSFPITLNLEPSGSSAPCVTRPIQPFASTRPLQPVAASRPLQPVFQPVCN